ncbi:putative drug exporter of the RND superfamily [Oceanobacillus limi]|uniref:Putative drug exporter of the RND superfamily n=1 Tax=Oceanobacillus limi TaxID=930131 RepID=A0A1I0B5K3_9BACI|nr:MMPL family transporter [Oceanobacillus limi]SET01384.1 putative drug exporter of the RND superfamily [Oceanobacillus limi]
MKTILQFVTDRVSSKKGTWITLGIWLFAMIVLTMFAPAARDYQVTSIESLPEDAPSVIATEKIEKYFEGNEQIPGLLVFKASTGEVERTDLEKITNQIADENISGVEEILPIGQLPPQATENFYSEDHKTAFIPLNFHPSLDTPDIDHALNQIHTIVENETNLVLYVTGPAGIAVDTTDLFTRADLVLIFSTVAIILVLLVVIYRSPLLAIIPLLGAVFVYQIVTQILGIFGKAGLLMSSQSVSIMSILLFAAVIDYSLFVFSRFREELKTNDDKYLAMKEAMRGTGLPVFYSGATVLAAMLILIFATLRDYQNFAPIFGTTLVVIILSSVTLIPALFTLFGRKSFWPVIPKVGDSKVKDTSFWSKAGHSVTNRPKTSVIVVGIFIIISASYLFNLKYEFDLIKSFPEDMSSRVGYEILENNFEAGELAPTTILLESEDKITDTKQQDFIEYLLEQELVADVRVDQKNDEATAITFSLTFTENPYAEETLDALETMQHNAETILSDNQINGELYFTGETATSVDDRSANTRDLILIVLLETILIFLMLIFLTRSFKMPIYMMGTILVSFGAALGLGMFLTNLFFDIDTISNRVPVYAFIFLVALGIDYNIILVSRFMEERKKKAVKEAVQVAVASTGGVISSAGLILAATFAVLMTQPIQLLFVFGFIVAVGILIDTFLIRGVLLPGLLVWFEKDRNTNQVKSDN